MYRWLTPLSEQFLSKDYLLSGQTVDERVNAICETAEKKLGKEGFAKRFKENFQKGWYSFSTPIWTNFGTERGLPISCFSSYISDNMDSILFTQAELGMMTKNGGGTSVYYGKLRGRGSPIRNNGQSSGSVHFMQLTEKVVEIISQGSARRGNCAVYLDIDHPDIMEFLNIKNEGFPIQNLSFGVCVPDKWMQSMIDGDYEKRKVWARVLESRINTGYPYILFVDNVNKNTVDVYKDKEMRIFGSNLCVAGDQRVVSNRGLKTAKELYEDGGELLLFDNEKIVKSSPMLLMEKNVDTYKINLSNGMSHTVTSYHKVKVRIGTKHSKNGWVNITENIQCSDIKVGDKVAIQTNKGIFGQKDTRSEAFLLGLYQGDGTQTNEIIMLDLWENDFDLVKEIETKFSEIFYRTGCDKYKITNQHNSSFIRKIKAPIFRNACVSKQCNVKKKRLASNCLKKALNFEKGKVPNWIWESNEDSQWQYVRGLFYTDGTVFVRWNEAKGNPLQLSLASIDLEFLKEVQLILNNLGMQTSIRLLRKEGESLLPDGKGGHKYYKNKTAWRLIISNKNDAIIFNEKTGFLDRKNIVLEKREYRDNTKKFYSVLSVEYVGKQDVYCCKVASEEHNWICNGVITHNCNEIMLPSSELESFVCDLSSMNILYYDEWKDTDAVELLVYFLDAVMTEFIEKAKNIPFMQRSVRFAERHRALGLGWLGWHSYLQSKMIPFESMKAKLKNVEIAKNIKTKAYAASKKLAEEFGEPELLKGYGRRNTTLLAIAPTKSSSFILGQVSEGIEPFQTNYYIKDLAKGKFTIKNKYLESLLESKGYNTEETWNSILKMGGSVQHLDFLDEDEKDVFKTFSEISQKEIIIQASQRQKYIDQGQSLNLMIHPSVSVKDINALVIEAWQLGIKGLYYQKSVNAAQQFSRNILSCKSCE
jgi:ribonucleoside-diphosphate reductase alpha chain